MIQDFSKEELAPAVRDTEVTLGAGAFLGLGAGLLLLCAICFGFGYMVGHRIPPDPSAAGVFPAQNAHSATIPVASSGKPGAASQSAPQTTNQSTADASSGGDDARATQTEQTGTDGRASQAEMKPATDAQVRPALAAQTQTGKSQVQGWMVQIAAVSRPEDAQVLVDALRKRGYEVMARKDVTDNLIHVQTGPFVNRNDANAMRQKLQNDGYNAIVQ